MEASATRREILALRIIREQSTLIQFRGMKYIRARHTSLHGMMAVEIDKEMRMGLITR